MSVRIERGVRSELAEFGLNGDSAVRRMRSRVRSAARCSARAESLEGVDISVSCVTEERIRTLNEQWRGLRRSTDVLSFPQWLPEELRDGRAVGPDGVIILGDVIVCPRVVARRAAGEELFWADLARVTVHGVLHLCGWDHTSRAQRSAMRRREAEILEMLGRRCRG